MSQAKLSRCSIDGINCNSYPRCPQGTNKQSKCLLCYFYFSDSYYQFNDFCYIALQDILKALGIPGALVLETSFDRPNLKYEVIAKTKEPLKQLGTLLKDRFENLSGIVYCLSKNECVEVSKFLNAKCSIKTVYYHAGLGARERVAVQKKWHTGEVEVVCATIAFGMGIDKPDVVSPCTC